MRAIGQAVAITATAPSPALPICFHHRMVSLFYRAWADAQPTVSFDRPETDRFNVYVGARSVLGMPSLWNRDAAPDLAKFHYAGRLACQTRNPEGLASDSGRFFQVAGGVETFVGHWLPWMNPAAAGWVKRRDRSARPDGGHRRAGVGLPVQVSHCHWPDELGGVSAVFARQRQLAPLVAWVRNYIGDELLWDVNLVLRKEEVPP
jgi:type VI secretion system protein ImpH